MNKDRAMAIQSEIQADFEALEAQLAAGNPGVLDVLRVFGQYDAVVNQADQYFNALKPAPSGTFAADNSTAAR